MGGTVIYDGSFNPDDKGLKVTITEVTIDENIQLNSEYSSHDFTGYTPVVIKATFENPTDKYIDTTAFNILDSEGETGQWNAYLEGVNTLDPDGLAQGRNSIL
ncbi:hypothetical protein STRDD10_00373 [Streptococcus sp. DD10]|uniref:hypothetical protein n=1 Tax=Streptococcus sp. DD10 TaxID=1777878 RepID=UPI000791B9DC|nr:hypothetical protein [Streptococcus sp. DD10]KXT75259.1 hypothetical protein STRDD10_00373 [Streptococcus sp. DD10]